MAIMIRAQNLTPEQMTAIRMATRDRVMHQLRKQLKDGEPVVRDLVAGDLFEGAEIRRRSRLVAQDVAPGIETVVQLAVLRQDRAIGIWGYATYEPQPQLDVISIAQGGVVVAELSLAEINAEMRTVLSDDSDEQVRRLARVGYISPPLLLRPNIPGELRLLSNNGIGYEEFNLLGLVAESIGVRIGVSQY